MTRARNCTSFLATMLTTLFALPLWAGVVFEVETIDHSDPSPGPESSLMSVEQPNLTMQIPHGSNTEAGAPSDQVIYHGGRRELIMVDHSNKSYVVMDQRSMSEMGGQVNEQMNQAMKELEKQLEGLDPQQREMMEKMLKGRMPPSQAGAAPKRSANEFRRTGEQAKKAGYPCVRWDVFRNGQKIREMWVTDWSNIEGGGEVRVVFEDVAAFFKELMDSIGDMMGGAGGFGDTDNMFDGFEEINGFPVVTRSYEDGDLESESTLKSARRQRLDPAAFEPPSGYKRRSMLGG